MEMQILLHVYSNTTKMSRKKSKIINQISESTDRIVRWCCLLIARTRRRHSSKCSWVPPFILICQFDLHTPLSLPLSRHPITDSDIQSLNVSLSEFSPAFNEDKGYFINMNSSHFFSFLFAALIRKVNNSMWMFSYILIFSLHVLFNLCYYLQSDLPLAQSHMSLHFNMIFF